MKVNPKFSNASFKLCPISHYLEGQIFCPSPRFKLTICEFKFVRRFSAKTEHDYTLSVRLQWFLIITLELRRPPPLNITAGTLRTPAYIEIGTGMFSGND